MVPLFTKLFDGTLFTTTKSFKDRVRFVYPSLGDRDRSRTLVISLVSRHSNVTVSHRRWKPQGGLQCRPSDKKPRYWPRLDMVCSTTYYSVTACGARFRNCVLFCFWYWAAHSVQWRDSAFPCFWCTMYAPDQDESGDCTAESRAVYWRPHASPLLNIGIARSPHEVESRHLSPQY